MRIYKKFVKTNRKDIYLFAKAMVWLWNFNKGREPIRMRVSRMAYRLAVEERDLFVEEFEEFECLLKKNGYSYHRDATAKNFETSVKRGAILRKIFSDNKLDLDLILNFIDNEHYEKALVKPQEQVENLQKQIDTLADTLTLVGNVLGDLKDRVEDIDKDTQNEIRKVASAVTQIKSATANTTSLSRTSVKWEEDISRTATQEDDPEKHQRALEAIKRGTKHGLAGLQRKKHAPSSSGDMHRPS